ncbi:MAG: HAMP domain-containing histidine kinase [Clostridia bacterium]|nr:HAMP domain-containing histidine kinase [Clostridia bacterium]
MKKETKPKNKKTNSEGTSLRFYFMLFSSVTLLLALGFSAGITALIQWLTQMRIPSEVWMLLLSLSIGTLLTLVTAHYIIRPITRLNRAMSRVAKGDFTVHLNENVRMGEISSAYRNFNTMVRALGTIETLQKDFTSNVSHEFKTPISAIEGYATLLQDPTQPEAVRQEYIGKILFNSARLSSLVGNVLLLSRLENQGVPAEQTTYRLDEQLREAVLLL